MASQDFQPAVAQQELITLAGNVDAIRRFRYVDGEHAALVRELVAAVEMMVSELVGAFDGIQGHYEPAVRVSSGRESAPLTEAALLAELCMMSRQEVIDRISRLRAEISKIDDGAEKVARSMGLLGTLRRSAVAVENALAEQAGEKGRLSARSELELAISIRGAFAALRRALGETAPPLSALAERLRGADTVLAGLLSRDSYWELSSHERTALHGLLQRLRLWLGAEDRDSSTGRYLWGDLRRFSEALGQLNERPQLVDHDRGVIRAVYSTLYAHGRPPEVVQPGLLRQLRRVEGRDPEVDRLLVAEESRASAWQAAIERLYEAL
jgi:hypothetical protein